MEGFKPHNHDKLGVHRPALGKPLLATSDPGIVAVASDEAWTGLPVPLLPLGDLPRIAHFIIGQCISL